ncbi:MAG: choice-of-anchor Q domain-containing protein [Thermoguttaceae bacterium]|jgi:hypothetical protein
MSLPKPIQTRLSSFLGRSPLKKRSPRSGRRMNVEQLEERHLLAVAAGAFSPEIPALFDSTMVTAAEVMATQQAIDPVALNSKVDSLYAIHLDFDGHTTSNTNWNRVYTDGADIVSPRFTLDGDTSKTSFTAAETAAIYEIWLRVAEDFMPFDVNVTTVEPAAEVFEAGRAQRVVIGGSCYDWYQGAAAGISWLGSFSKNQDVPNFVFSEVLYGSLKYIAETVTHEMGHALGLNHKGNSQVPGQSEYYQGTNGWAPIMGTAYYQELTQWSKGEYYGANSTVDELAVITTNNGFGYRDDDHADSFDGATVLTITDAAGMISGIIERNTDIDCFVFESDGSPLSFLVGGITGLTNLDTLVKIYSEDRQLLHVDDPADRLDVEFLFTGGAGTYYITVEGTGLETDWSGIYSDYGSLGGYTIRVGYPESLVVTTLDDTIVDDGDLSLREAILFALDRTTILFDESLAGGVITLGEGEIQVNRAIRVDASAIGGITIDAQGLSRVLEVTGSATLVGLTVTGGAETTRGAGIYNTGNVTLIDCVLRENIASEHAHHLVGGGAIYNDTGATASLIDCELTGNKGNFGGAIYNVGTLLLDRTMISGSAAWQWNGGAIYNRGTVLGTDSCFSGNQAKDYSGSIVGGGAIYNAEGAEASFTATEFLQNIGTFGGAIVNFGTCALDTVLMDGNTISSYRGGAVYNYAQLSVTNSTFSANIAPAAESLLVGGGAIYNAQTGTATITQSLFHDNAGNFGGAIVNAGQMTITASTVARNYSNTRDGGGILNAGTLEITNTLLAENVSNESHPDLYAYAGTVTGSYNLSSFADWGEGAGNIVWTGEGLFLDSGENPFTPAPGSAAVDAGSNALVLTETDLAGNTRIYNLAVDIGALEYCGTVPRTLPAPTITAVVSAGGKSQTVRWLPVTGAVSYQVSVLCGGITQTYTTEGLSQWFDNLTYGAEAVYTVRAIGDGLTTVDSGPSESYARCVSPCDIDGDGFIGPGDYALFSSVWLTDTGSENWDPQSDIDGDGTVGPGDYAFLSVNWLKRIDDGTIVYPG